MHFNVLLFNFEWFPSRCHHNGLIVLNSANRKNVCFSGKRRPWIFLLNARRATIIIKATSQHKLTIFYSIQNIKWMHSFSKQIYRSLDNEITFTIPPVSKVYSEDEMLHFHVAVYPMKRLAFIFSGRSDVAVAVFDGPGFLSKRLPEVRKNTFQTSGYIGSFALRQKESFNLIITVQFASRKSRVATCFNGKQRALPLDIFAYASENKGTACFKIFNPQDHYLQLVINTFVYRGPTSFDGVSDCQYGGLFVEQITLTKSTSICANRENYVVFGEIRYFKLLIIYYSGYSHGFVSAQLHVENCITKYIAGSSLQNYNQILIKDSRIHCQRIICTSFNEVCHFHIKRLDRPLGIARINVVKLPSLHSCEGSYHTTKYNLSALYSENWLFEGNQLIKISANETKVFEFNFLQDVNISLPYTCDRQMPLLQLGIILERSTCYLSFYSKRVIPAVLLNSLEVTDCVDRTIFVNLQEVTYFIYTVAESKKTETGSMFRVSHGGCTERCKNYTYIMTVKYDNTLTRYTSKGDLFTGYFHQGFKVTVIPHTNHCSHRCEIGLLVYRHEYPIGSHKETIISHDTQEWHIYSKRYCMRFSPLSIMLSQQMADRQTDRQIYVFKFAVLLVLCFVIP